VADSGPNQEIAMAHKITPNQLEELARITTWDASNRHFTVIYDHWEALETEGLVAIHRPHHEGTGLPFDPRTWTVEVTREGQEIVDTWY
jgi:hypothetical protein